MASEHPFDLTRSRALVTGGGSGLGLAIARGLARAGSQIVLNGRNRDKPRRAVEALAAEGIAASVAPFDVTDAAAVAESVADVERRLGPVDILVNNAAMNQRKPLEDFTPEEWRTLMAANLDCPFLVTRAFIPAMKALRTRQDHQHMLPRRRSGPPEHRSLCGEQGRDAMLTPALAVELGTVEYPGERYLSGILQDGDECAAHRRRGILRLGIMSHAGGPMGGTPRDRGRRRFSRVAAADYVTGHVLYVDGGFSAAY